MAGLIDKWLTEDALLLITGWARDGLTQKDIAHNMGVCLSTLTHWLTKNETLRKAINDGKEVADRRVENALYKRALGYTITETTVTQSEKDGYKEVTTTKHIPGDVTAQIYWLKNRKPKQWRDRQETAITADIEDLTPLVELLK